MKKYHFYSTSLQNILTHQRLRLFKYPIIVAHVARLNKASKVACVSIFRGVKKRVRSEREARGKLEHCRAKFDVGSVPPIEPISSIFLKTSTWISIGSFRNATAQGMSQRVSIGSVSFVTKVALAFERDRRFSPVASQP